MQTRPIQLAYLTLLSIVLADLPPNWTPCKVNVCLNGGTCYDDNGAQFCHCTPEFGDKYCERMLEQSNKDSEESRIASLSLACWILALLLCLAICFGVLGWIFFRKARHEIEDLQEENQRLSSELKKLLPGRTLKDNATEQDALIKSTTK